MNIERRTGFVRSVSGTNTRKIIWHPRRSVMNKCRACRVWEFRNETIIISRGGQKKGAGGGICKRHSPTPGKIFWPATLGDDWCGDFEKLDWPEENPPAEKKEE
jgi:hypothetical protein